MMTGIHKTALVAALVCSAGCGDYTSSWKNDNPTIRKIQREETDRYITDDNQKRHLKDYLGKRVRIVYSGDALEPSDGFLSAGRAAALTQDGYFLTAFHVVEGHAFYIEETKMLRKPPSHEFKTSESSKYISNQRSPGRLVWSDSKADIAILKFPVKGHPYFDNYEANQTGLTVFTADDEGYGTFAADARGEVCLENLVGNGAFFAAGCILEGTDERPAARATTFSTSLVARRGMSGAPLVTSNYGLCGVLSRVEGIGPFQKPRTIATMIDPRLIAELVAADRKAQTKQTSYPR
ncbi:trypsin-like peptidase domain-containing protein [Luteolibacter pohnpeiensis]|uniref:Trypsin-like peptidase domain-containing protein n=1 Tax=Luteolibacter pohnpeiensis TaxID=454153 RepID=A0A934SDX3_9BACT|nr:serine protease [Luteolibacter pohnpeiensis]MBK1884337.1 trypsin-like peptidase domain-containing protein [Luteolibacter pohnpeiensis]